VRVVETGETDDVDMGGVGVAEGRCVAVTGTAVAGTGLLVRG
jgi:hypothetical protein